MANGNHVRHVEVGVDDLLSCGHSQSGVVKSSAEINFLVADMLEADERIVRGHLRVIAVGVRLR